MIVHPEAGSREWHLISVRDIQTEKTVCDLKLPEIQGYDYISGFHPDNRTFAVGWKNNILVFDLTPPASPLDPEILFGCSYTGAPMGWARPTALYPLGGERDDWVHGLWYSADGKFLKVMRYHGEALLLSSPEGQVLQRMLCPHGDKGYGSVISQSGRAAKIVAGKTAATWDVPWWVEV